MTLSSPSSQFVTVHYSTLNGTASANDDYAPMFGVITFAPGQTTFNLPVMYSPASPGEGDETRHFGPPFLKKEDGTRGDAFVLQGRVSRNSSPASCSPANGGDVRGPSH